MYTNNAKSQENPSNISNHLIKLLQQLSSYELSNLGTHIKMSLQYGRSTVSTERIQQFGGGCRDTQLKARKKLLELGLLEHVYNRIRKGSMKNRSNMYIVADWLLDGSLASIIRIFCKVPWYAPIRGLKLYLTQEVDPLETSTSVEVDSILVSNLLLTPSSLKLFLKSIDNYGALSPETTTRVENPGVSYEIGTERSTTRVENPDSNATGTTTRVVIPDSNATVGAGFVNKTVQEPDGNEEKNLKREDHKLDLNCKAIFNSKLEEARNALKRIPSMKAQRIALGMPMTEEKEIEMKQRLVSTLSVEEREALKSEGLI